MKTFYDLTIQMINQLLNVEKQDELKTLFIFSIIRTEWKKISQEKRKTTKDNILGIINCFIPSHSVEVLKLSEIMLRELLRLI